LRRGRARLGRSLPRPAFQNQCNRDHPPRRCRRAVSLGSDS
jgi:hypothetical protein